MDYPLAIQNNVSIMTGLDRNRQIYLPREIKDSLHRVSIDRGAARSIETLGEVILNLI